MYSILTHEVMLDGCWVRNHGCHTISRSDASRSESLRSRRVICFCNLLCDPLCKGNMLMAEEAENDRESCEENSSDIRRIFLAVRKMPNQSDQRHQGYCSDQHARSVHGEALE